MLWWTQLADYGRFSQCTLICIYSTGTTLKKQHISRGEIRLAIKWYIIITSSTDAHWTEPLIAAGPECCEFVIFLFFFLKGSTCSFIDQSAKNDVCILRAAALLSQPLVWSEHWCLILTECHPNWGYFWNNMHKELVAGPPWPHTHHTPC